MKKILTLIMCLLYTFIAIGGSVYVHYCGEQSVLTVYEKHSHDDCPMCIKSAKDNSKSNGCHDGSCKDVEVKIDQLSEKFFSANKSEKFNLEPIILQRHWVDLNNITLELPRVKPLNNFTRTILTNSPPEHILYCNFRN